MKRVVFLLFISISITSLSAQEYDSITDVRDGQVYKILKIGNQWWMAENLNAGMFVKSIDTGSRHSDQSDNDTIEKYCYLNDTNNCKTYGGLYEWNEMMSYNPSDAGETGKIQGVCPAGWHVPTDEEWKTLEMFLGMSQEDADATGWRGTNEGGKLKETGTLHWDSPNTGATNESGFTAIPTSYRVYNGYFPTFGIDHYTTFWTATAEHSWDGIGRQLYDNQAAINRGSWDREDGMPVRCIKDPCLFKEVLLEKTDITCQGETDGSITINVTGTGPFSYKWSTDDTTAAISDLTAGWYSVTVTDSLLCSITDSIQIIEPDPLTAMITDSSNTSSSGAMDGTATITPSGGTPPYTYLWDNLQSTTDSTATGLTDNIWYHVIISDANMCTVTDSVMLSVAEVLQAEIVDSTNISCWGASDGTATVMVTGGIKPYQINWDDDAGSSTETVTDLEPGRWYHVTITDKIMQTMTDSVILTEPDLITISKEYSHKICQDANDGYIELEVSGGTFPYTYDWNTGTHTPDIYDLGVGKYIVTITDANGCILEDSTLIESIVSNPIAEICMVTLSPNWKNLIVWEKEYGQGIEAYNIYRIQVLDTLLLTTQPFDSFSVYEDNSSEPEIGSYIYMITAVDSCGNESEFSEKHITVHFRVNPRITGGIDLSWSQYQGYPVYYYQIYRGTTKNDLIYLMQSSALLFSKTDPDPPPGLVYYQVAAVRGTPCSPSSTYKASEIYDKAFSNVDDNGFVEMVFPIEYEDLSIYPNPFHERTTITFPNPKHEKHQLIIRDMTGKVVKQIDDLTNNKVELNCSNLFSGLYVIELRGPKIYRKKIIIE